MKFTNRENTLNGSMDIQNPGGLRVAMIQSARSRDGIPLVVLLLTMSQKQWKEWGYKTYAEYLERDLGFRREEAEWLSRHEAYLPLQALVVKPAGRDNQDCK